MYENHAKIFSFLKGRQKNSTNLTIDIFHCPWLMEWEEIFFLLLFLFFSWISCTWFIFSVAFSLSSHEWKSHRDDNPHTQASNKSSFHSFYCVFFAFNCKWASEKKKEEKIWQKARKIASWWCLNFNEAWFLREWDRDRKKEEENNWRDFLIHCSLNYYLMSFNVEGERIMLFVLKRRLNFFFFFSPSNPPLFLFFLWALSI